jgi:hypothetical protein
LGVATSNSSPLLNAAASFVLSDPSVDDEVDGERLKPLTDWPVISVSAEALPASIPA